MPTCLNDGCDRRFTRTRPWQKYCSQVCRAEHRNTKIRGRYISPSAVSVVNAAMYWFHHGGAFEAQLKLREACSIHGVSEDPDEEALQEERDGR